MSLVSRRGFFGTIIAAFVARRLPAPRIDPGFRFVPTSEAYEAQADLLNEMASHGVFTRAVAQRVDAALAAREHAYFQWLYVDGQGELL